MAWNWKNIAKVDEQTVGDNYALYRGDSCEILKGIPDNSVHYSVFSPPFNSLYTYSNSDRDLGNCRTKGEFFEHFMFIVSELFRVIMPGRLVSFHCMNLPTSKERDGFIGIDDFRGDLIRVFQSVGFIFHSEVCIWKNPVTAMQRTKALGLLHKQLVKDSAMSRQGIADYLVTMRKPGVNAEPIHGRLEHYTGDDMTIAHTENTHDERGTYSIEVWQRYASPVWMDINQSDTLQRESAREEKDERHVCPLQLQVIERALQLWSNEGDIVLSPFGGIGSEIYKSVLMGRHGIGIELKKSYYDQMVKNCKRAEDELNQMTLFDTATK